MFHLDTLGRHVSRKIKIRGTEYFERNAVRILFSDTEFVSARVSGSREYEVDLERDREALIFSCDCPYFEENYDVCKHVWATLLEMEKQGIVKKWVNGTPTELVPMGSDLDEDSDDDLEDYDFEDEERLPAGKYTESVRKAFGASTGASWQQILDRLGQTEEQPQPSQPWLAGREILYVLEAGTLTANTTIQIDVRERRKNGDWKKQKALVLSHDTLQNVPDPIDREILARLMGVRRETWYYGPYESIYRFEPKPADIQSLLPLISSTGRLCFRSPKLDEFRMVHWDDKGPWEFRIYVRPDENGRQYEVCAGFCRREERLGLSQPEYLSRQGIFLLGETIGSFQGSFDWILFFQREISFFVPYAEIDVWLEKMLGMPSLPVMELPEELRLQEIEVTPRPIVRVRTQKEAWGSSYLLGELFFDYQGRVIKEGEPATAIALVRERRKILRKAELEGLAVRKLEESGFQRRKDYAQREMIWTIAQSRLPAAVRDLAAEGWQVEAEGKLFRHPGSLKLHLSSGIDWFELHGTVNYGDTSVTIPRLLAALKRHENAILLDDGSFGMLPEEWLEKYGMLVGLGTSKGDHVRFNRNQAGLLDAFLAAEPEASCDELFEHVRAELRNFGGIAAIDPAQGFQGSLRPYQREGLGWMQFLNRFGFGGCLADDMGLGKTIQVLALLEGRRLLRHAREAKDRPPPSLVVMPRSLVFNWLQEAARFTPELRILDHTGGERIRSHEHFDQYDAIFTTYGTLRRDTLFFKEKVFDYLILDEAQAIKNASTESAKAARLLHGRYRLALSGTPIENHLGELWSLFEFLNPGMLGSSSVFKLGRGSIGKLEESHRALLAQALRPFILRRTKKQVAQDLPAKVEQTLYCQLEAPQRALYDELRTHYRRTLLERIESEGLGKSKIHVLEALLRLRQAAIHPGLIDPSREGQASAKLDMLMPQLLEVLDEGHKALIFSQFTSMLAILRRRLDEEGITYEYLDGQTKDRSVPVERFQNDPDSKVFLISLKAGGLGLNLTAAEYVFLMDPWWNPAVEAQAVDRTHRIGQNRSVFAYRLIAKDTVEEKVVALQETKREIADAIINQDNSLMRNLSTADLELLLS
jgi:superfamily II DNA or RNA helicase